jgi:hypothetical protein
MLRLLAAQENRIPKKRGLQSDLNQPADSFGSAGPRHGPLTSAFDQSGLQPEFHEGVLESGL